MDLGEYIDEITDNKEQKRRKYAKEKSYQIMETIDISDIKKKFLDIKKYGEYRGDTNSVFVGNNNYPNVSTGILSPIDDSSPESLNVDSSWYNQQLDINQILGRRLSLINSKNQESNSDVYDVWDGYTGVQREIAMADSPTDVNIKYRSVPNMSIDTDDVASPTGPQAKARDANLNENPSIPVHIKKTLEDDDWKSTGAMKYLYNKEYDVYKINQILSTPSIVPYYYQKKLKL